MKNLKPIIIPFLLATHFGILAQNSLQNGFKSPPNAAKPRVWWHWMNGNITKEGIQKDLEWMEKVGIGGFQNFDANLFTPVMVPQKLVFMQPAWKEAFKFTTQLAQTKGLEMAIAGSPGWSVTGGPWVAPADAMKKYVWSETIVQGGKLIKEKLPELPNVAGKFQKIGIAEGITSGFIGQKPTYSEEAFVVAYKLSDNEKHLMDLKPKMTKSGGNWDVAAMLDRDHSTTYTLPATAIGQDKYVQYEFEQAQTFKAFAIAVGQPGGLAEFNGVPLNRRLKVSDDGINFRTIVTLSSSINPFITTAIPTTTAKFWRMCFETLPGEPNIMAAISGQGPAMSPPAGTDIAEFVLFNTTRIDQAEDKAGFIPWKEDNKFYTPTQPDIIAAADVIDLTPLVAADGTLTWSAPAGQWMVVRFGASPTGRQNHPASPEATGLEVDKLDKEAVRRYINTYLDMYKDATGGLMGAQGLTHMVLDSYEAGHMTWTKNMPQEFFKRRGYDLKPYVPVLVGGRVVNSVADSEKFLWDFRKTIGEMITENHYEVIGQELKKRGMKRYTESHEDRRIFLADGMDVKRYSDIPMAAMWTPGSLAGGNDEEVRSEGDIREAASVANIYGQNIVAAESMTSIQNAFSWHPEKLKRTADLEMASGLNRFVIHTSVHQPLDDKKPGFSLGPFGQYFTRHETWSGAGAKAWIDYLSKSCQLLQQGKNIADILVLYGENTNITWLCREKLPNIPNGFEFDFVNATALLNGIIKPQNGKLIAKSGNQYQVLMLHETTNMMTLPLLKKLKSLVEAGIKIVGTKPIGSPSLADNDAEFQVIANTIWSNNNVVSFDETKLKADVIITGAANKILYRHRKTATEDIYWLNNRADAVNEAEVSFRITGKIPELWHAQTGKIEKLSYKIQNGRTIVPLHFDNWDAYFVVFRNKTSKLSYTKPATTQNVITSISTPWQLNIGDKTLNMPKLTSWADSDDIEVKYYAGTATYTNTFTINVTKGVNESYLLDLGEVKNIAEVIVNGKTVGTLWKKPFKIDITNAVKTGINAVEIKVTNLWVNRLIGDAQPGAVKTTFTTMPFYRGNESLLPSGLLGEVKILVTK